MKSGWSTNKSGADLSDSMRRYADRRTRALSDDDLSGYVLKKDSPSCGMERVRIYAGNGMPARDGRGLYADALIRRYPNLPVEEEGRLNDARLRENFIERVFAYRRLKTLFAGTLDDRRTGRVPYRAQAATARPFAVVLCSTRTDGRDCRCRRARRIARALRKRIHGRAQENRHARASGQRAAAHGRLLSRSARARIPAANWPR